MLVFKFIWVVIANFGLKVDFIRLFNLSRIAFQWRCRLSKFVSPKPLVGWGYLSNQWKTGRVDYIQLRVIPHRTAPDVTFHSAVRFSPALPYFLAELTVTR
jgi:hypothetical protein